METLDADQIEFLNYLVTECRYRGVRLMPGGRYAAIAPYLFTQAIIVGQVGDRFGFDDRWCYETYDKARAALDCWNGEGEPAGWHRHPLSGRRVSEAGEEYVRL